MFGDSEIKPIRTICKQMYSSINQLNGYARVMNTYYSRTFVKQVQEAPNLAVMRSTRRPTVSSRRKSEASCANRQAVWAATARSDPAHVSLIAMR